MAVIVTLVDSERAAALVDREVERAIAPYRGVLPEEALIEMAAFVRDALFTHPAVAPEVGLLCPPEVVQSAEVATIPEEPGVAQRREGSGGRGTGGA